MPVRVDGRFGPNTEAVEALLERASQLTDDEVDRLEAAWLTTWSGKRDSAWDAVLEVARNDDTRRRATTIARGAVLTTAPNWVWDALWGAACALVVKNLITDAQFNVLYGPWASVVERASQ